jgi:CRISPR-associated protein Cmr4
METQKHILYIYAETPLHVGTGTGLGAVDMPIQREKHTNYPIIQASGVKGAIRDNAEIKIGRDNNKAVIQSIFGADSDNREITHASAISPSDARILLFPVRALNGVFVWLTSCSVLERFKRETGAHNAPDTPENTKHAQLSDGNLAINRQVMLEEYTYDAQQTELAKAWGEYLSTYALIGQQDDYWKKRLQTHLIILPDNDFRDFVTYSTDIVTRIHIDDEKKTVKDGQLFTQELLPADSLLYSVLYVTSARDQRFSAGEVVNELKNVGHHIQIGGDETVGRGRVQLNWQEV